jgi:hypothetical protein
MESNVSQRIDQPEKPDLATWFRVFGFDAAVVALVWQETFARFLGVHLLWPTRVGLVIAVCLIYLLDRLLDASDKVTRPKTSRHALALRYFPWLAMLVMVLAVIGVWLAGWHIPQMVAIPGVFLMIIALVQLGGGHATTPLVRWFRGGMFLLLGLILGLVVMALGANSNWSLLVAVGVLWLGIAQSFRKPTEDRPVFELSVLPRGLVFATGCMMGPGLMGFPAGDASLGSLFLPLLGFGFLAASSMSIVDATEGGVSYGPARFLAIMGGAIGLLVAFTSLPPWGYWMALSLGISSVAMLLVLATARCHSSRTTLLGDICLLSPAILWIWQ